MTSAERAAQIAAEVMGLGQRTPAEPELTKLLLDGGQAVLDAPTVVPALWGRAEEVLWPEDEALMLVGPPGVGKTTLMGQVVRGRLGLGGAVLGWPVKPGTRRVLYLAMDRPSQIRRSLRRQFTEDDRDVLTDRLRLWPGPPPADLAGDTELLLRMAEAADADTVVVDSLKDAAIGLAKDEVGAAYNQARQRALREGVQIAELHHQRKESNGGGKPNRLADVYGSTWLTSGAGSVVLLWGEAGDMVVELSHLKPSMETVGPLRLMHDPATGTTVIEPVGDLEALARACLLTGLTVSIAAEHLFGASKDSQITRNNAEKARRRLEKLAAQGLLEKRPGNRGGAAGEGETAYFPVDPAPRLEGL